MYEFSSNQLEVIQNITDILQDELERGILAPISALLNSLKINESIITDPDEKLRIFDSALQQAFVKLPDMLGSLINPESETYRVAKDTLAEGQTSNVQIQDILATVDNFFNENNLGENATTDQEAILIVAKEIEYQVIEILMNKTVEIIQKFKNVLPHDKQLEPDVAMLLFEILCANTLRQYESILKSLLGVCFVPGYGETKGLTRIMLEYYLGKPIPDPD